jgi:NitT/TauT family transport system ATP-binding protein
VPPTHGTITVNGAVVHGTAPDGLAVVFQDNSRSLYAWLSVRGKVALPPRLTQPRRPSAAATSSRLIRGQQGRHPGDLTLLEGGGE